MYRADATHDIIMKVLLMALHHIGSVHALFKYKVSTVAADIFRI